MIERRLVAGEELAEDQQQAEVEALSLRNECDAVGQQGRQWADSGHSSRQRSGMHSGRWAEAAHLFRPNLAPNWKMLPSRRHRAGAFDVGALSTARAFALATAERVFVQRHGVKECTKTPRPVVAHALLRLERAPAMDGCAGTWSLGWTP